MNYKDILKAQTDELTRIRRRNLQLLVTKYGSQKALAIALSRTPSQIGQLVRDNSPKGIGDDLTRYIEKELGLATGSLDRPAAKIEKVKTIANEILNVTRIPVLSSVQAGSPTDHGDICFDEFIEVPGKLPKGCYALKVTGDSMSPLIDNGDVVVVDPDRWPKPGDCIVARSGLENLSEATVKRYYPVGFDASGREVFEARPFNEMYPVMHSVDQKLEIIGTVCKLIKDK
jgi:SOS-response transcriptional repressor LexA